MTSISSVVPLANLDVMESAIPQSLAWKLKGAHVRIEASPKGYVVVLAGPGEPYRSAPFTAREAEAVKRFLQGFRDHRQGNLHGEFDEIVETCRRRYPDISADTIRAVVGTALDEGWPASALVEELARQSYARVLQNHREAGAWGVLVMTQRDGNVCSVCRQFDNVAYHLDRAIEEHPLPHAGCANRTCRCRYLPVFREKDLYAEVEKRV